MTRHRKAKLKVSSKTADQILRRHFGKSPHGIRPIIGGLSNYVYEAKIGREALIIRISDDAAKLQVFMKEQWAITMAGKAKVPTPEVLEVCNDVADLPYMISRKVPGRAATTIGRHRLRVLAELGAYGARINSIRTKDFGHIFDWSPNRLSRNETWKKYLDVELKIEERLELFRRAKILSPAKLKNLTQHIQQMKRWSDAPSLTHGDLRLKNVILDENRNIVAILDWEDCSSNIAPYWELSIALHDLSMDEKEAFLEGYGMKLKDYMEIAPAVKTFNILNYAGAVGIALEQKDRAKLDSFEARLNGTFDLYSL